MTDAEEQAYEDGGRSAWRLMLQQCLIYLGYRDEAAAGLRWIVEREEAIAQLREICGVFGDNDWEPTLNLADILDKHLARHLHGG